MVRNLRWFRWVQSMTPAQVAVALITGLHKESSEILVGWQSKVAVLLNRFIPWLVKKVLSLGSPQPAPCPAPQPLILRSKLGRSDATDGAKPPLII